MSISIVMLTYNNYEKFMRSMNSMFYFITEPKIKEFIFLDNGSHEVELKKFLRSLEKQIEKVRVIFSDTNLGIAKGRKVLFDTAEGEYIASFDSDIVIVNPPLFLEVFYKALDIPDMMLVGGGGGDHPYFPSLERENIDNKESPENSGELLKVDEVAGWFHGFKSKILTKHGGQIEMDEQFSPFWSEDSDFCMQIKMLGGKCCIMGKGIVGHRWSSCDKKKTQVTLEEMWNKFQDKWYGKFGEDFKFEIEDKFYESNYPESKNLIRSREYYYKIGMIEGHFYSKETIRHLFNDVVFVNNKTIKFKNSSEEMTIHEFNNKYFTYDNIIDRNFFIVLSTLPKNIENLIILPVFDLEKGLNIIKNLISHQHINIAIVIDKEVPQDPFVNIFKKYSCNFAITTFPNMNFDLIPYIITAKELMKIYKIKNILNLSTERENSEYLLREIKSFIPGYYLEHQLKKIDNLNMSFIDQLLTMDQNMMWNKDCVYYESTEYLTKLFDSFPVMDTLIKSLKIPKKYINYISPRCSPKHSLERLLGYIKPKIFSQKKTLYLVVANIKDQESLEKLKNNISFYKKGEILILNKGILRNINLKYLNCEYYFNIDENSPIENIWLSGLSQVDLSAYSNVVFSDDSFELVDNIDNFLERSLYKNNCFCRKENKYDLSLFSLVIEIIPHFSEKLKQKEDIEKYLKEVHTRISWIAKIEENDEETILTYEKPGYDDGEDFPMI